MIDGLALGAPGLYRTGEERVRALTGERMDVCAFVGVAPRGPARLPTLDTAWAPQPCREGERATLAVPTAVESWEGYLRLYGGFEGPGLLPYAVSAFFQNGGRRAYVVRIVHSYFRPDGTADEKADDLGRALLVLDGLFAAGGRQVTLAARDEGAWGGRLRATLAFATRPLALAAGDFLPDRIRLPRGADVTVGAVLRLALGGGVKVLRQVIAVTESWDALAATREAWARLDLPTAGAAHAAELVEGTLTTSDGIHTAETIARIGLAAQHPRWLARVLAEESALLWPAPNPELVAGDPLAEWLDADLDLTADLASYATKLARPGADRYADLVPDDFFDSLWAPGDECPGSGVHSLVDLADLSLLVVPDLYSPAPLVPVQPVVDGGGFAGAEFAECVEAPPVPPQAKTPDDLYGLRLDPASELDAIVALQQRLVELAEQLRSLIVLLDVPPAISQRRMLYWRGKFSSAWCAGYHPWLTMAPSDDARGRPVAVNPAAAAAGVIAQREHQFGVQHGPANVVAVGAVGVADAVSRARHDELHQQAINVYLAERDGVRLTAARTLAGDPAWRQLSVRRLVTLLCRAIERQMQWTVFEPNDAGLRRRVSLALETYLRGLYRANAFTGATEREAFFVRCDDALNPRQAVDAGRLYAQVGVAPAEPMEFIVLDIERGADSALTVEA